MEQKQDKHQTSTILQPPSQPQKDPTAWLDSVGGKVAGVIVAAGATLIATRTAISAAFFKSMNKGPDGAFADLQRTRDMAINRITSPAKSGATVPDAMERIREINNTYDKAYVARRKTLHIHGVLDECKALKKHQRMEVMITAAAVATAAIGAIMTIASSRESGKKIDLLEEENRQGQGRGI